MATRQQRSEANGWGIDCVNARSIPWRPSPAAARVHVKDLGATGRGSIQLVRYDAGASLTLSAEGRLAFLYVLDGELVHGGVRLWPGTAASLAHGGAAAHSDLGCTFVLVRWGAAEDGDGEHR